MLAVEVTDDHAATVDVEDAWQERAGGLRGGVDAHGNVGLARCPGDGALFGDHLVVGRDVGGHGLQKLPHECPALDDVGDRIESAGDGKTSIEGIYGPNANVWSLFLYGYLITGTLAVFAACIGLVQVMLDHTPWGLWVLGLMLAAVVTLYVVAQFGQKLGVQQTFVLHQAYEAAIGQSVEIC